MANYHNLPPDLRSSIFISSSIGGLMQLIDGEKDIRKIRKINEIIYRLKDLICMYPEWKNYDYVAIGTAIFLKIEEELQKLVEQQLERENEEKTVSE